MDITNEQVMPKYRICHSMTSARPFIFIYGGFDDIHNINHNELWSYNTLSGVWKQYHTPIEIKDTCHSSSSCAVRNLVYIFGGGCIDGDYFRMTNSLISFDISDATWEIVFPHIEDYDDDTPYPMSLCLLFYHNESLYVLGTNDQDVEEYECEYEMYKFCLKTPTWSKVRQIGVVPIFRYNIFGTVYNNKLYTFNDPDDPKNKYRNIWIFDFSNHTWTTKETNSKNQQYPEDRFDESFAFSSKFGYMSGGVCPYTFNGYSDIWRFDLDTLEWLKLDYSLKACLSRHVMLVVDDLYLYSFGGRCKKYRDLNLLQKFILQPPTLYRLSIESVLRSPNVKIYIKSLPPSIRDEFDINDDYSYVNI
ncbi:Tip elongation aberrant protein 3 [Thelohanellus kitauei]|uniref:Tip elongation aberrant protein 3 n=1 Tax=Thelohanellus kitauei TaxID=669202 RepID=A0A0C2N2T4_THEKT|nr:Tip elongation aberrant protein 3 [Thelohanellus kitauei]